MFKDVIELVSKTYEKDELQQEIETVTKRMVFANKRSVSQSEFFSAGQTNIKSSQCFVIRLSEYNNELNLIYNNKNYSIYRIFEIGENVELYCEVRIGG